MPSVASEVAASIAHRRDAQVQTSAANDRNPSSAFAEMLDSSEPEREPAKPAVASRADRPTAAPAKRTATDAAKSDAKPAPKHAAATVTAWTIR